MANGIEVVPVTADGRFGADGAIHAGSNVFTSPSGAFTNLDEGKTFAVSGAAAGQDTLEATIVGCISPTQVQISVNASYDVSGAKFQYGTDNAPILHQAKQSLTEGGCLQINEVGYIFASSIDMTNCASLRLEGVIDGANNLKQATRAGLGTCIVPTTQAAVPLIDMTGSNAPWLRQVLLGSTLSPIRVFTHVFMGPSADDPAFSERVKIDDVFATGLCATASFYCFATSIARVQTCKWQSYGTNPMGMFLTSENIYGVQSRYATVLSGIYGGAGGLFTANEVHATSLTNQVNAGTGLRIRGRVGQSVFQILSVDAQSSGGAIVVEKDSAGNTPDCHSYNGLGIYSEGSFKSQYGWQVDPGCYQNVFLQNYTRDTVAPVLGTFQPKTAFQAA
jgi:hypothetical protein